MMASTQPTFRLSAKAFSWGRLEGSEKYPTNHSTNDQTPSLAGAREARAQTRGKPAWPPFASKVSQRGADIAPRKLNGVQQMHPANLTGCKIQRYGVQDLHPNRP